MKTILWHIPASHYNEKARWALDLKGVPHERRTPIPGAHRAHVMMLTRGTYDRLPLLQLDGERIGDSSAIIAALEQAYPEPPLYPADPETHARALELEQYFDRELGPRVRRWMFFHTIDDADATIKAVSPQAGRLQSGFMKAAMPVMRPVFRRDYEINEKEAGEAERGVREILDLIEGKLNGEGYLAGDSFSVADLAGAALFTPLIAPPERPFIPDHAPEPVLSFRAELEARPGGAWVKEMYARHRPPDSGS